jgi:hypothetical protein
MELFHFTHQPGLKGILNLREVLASAAALPSNMARIEGYGVHLTSDPRPDGHGLPDGRVISDGQSTLFGYKVRDGNQARCLDHRMFRLRILIPAGDQNLEAFAALPGMNPEFEFAADVAAHIPVRADDEAQHDLELVRVAKKLRAQPELRKSGTWWIYRRNLPLDFVTHVAYRNEDGSYHEGTLAEVIKAAS